MFGHFPTRGKVCLVTPPLSDSSTLRPEVCCVYLLQSLTRAGYVTLDVTISDQWLVLFNHLSTLQPENSFVWPILHSPTRSSVFSVPYPSFPLTRG